MTFPAYDMVTFEDNMYHSRLYHLYKHDSWAPEPEKGHGLLSKFPVCLTSCWPGYLTVFSAKLNENFKPSWILTFSPVEECPTLYGGMRNPEVKPQPVPEFIDGAPVPQRGHRFESAYDISNIRSCFGLWELGLILWKDQKKYLLEIGRLDGKVNRVLGLRELS